MIDGLSGYLKAIVKERKTLESYANQMEVKDTQQVVKNQVQKVKTKEVEVSKQDLAKINAVKKQVKKNESLNQHMFVAYLDKIVLPMLLSQWDLLDKCKA